VFISLIVSEISLQNLLMHFAEAIVTMQRRRWFKKRIFSLRANPASKIRSKVQRFLVSSPQSGFEKSKALIH
jgi:hypothetical protein